MAQIYLMYSPSYAAKPPYRDPEMGTWFTSNYVCDASTGNVHLITSRTENPAIKADLQEDAYVVAVVDKDKIVSFERDTSESDALLAEANMLLRHRLFRNPTLLIPEIAETEFADMYAKARLTENNPLDSRDGDARLWKRFDALIKDRGFSEQEVANVRRAFQEHYKISPVAPGGTTGSRFGTQSPQFN